jgi:hypothetical protein
MAKPHTAYLLLRKAAADAFRRRDVATYDRLTEEAATIILPESGRGAFYHPSAAIVCRVLGKERASSAAGR